MLIDCDSSARRVEENAITFKKDKQNAKYMCRINTETYLKYRELEVINYCR
jgi:hypothetical protein